MSNNNKDCNGCSSDISFNNAEVAFKSKSFAALLRGYFVFLLCSSKLITDNTDKLLKIGEKLLGKRLFSIFMKMTFYGHFVGGEDKEAVKKTVKLLRKYGVKSILDYAVEEDIASNVIEEKEIVASTSEIKRNDDDQCPEDLGGETLQYKPTPEFADRRENVISARSYFYENERTCDKNAEAFIESIRTTAENEECGFIAVKLTALGRPQLLYQLSEVIMRARIFVTKITGKHGNVIGQKLTLEELEEKLIKVGIEDVKEFIGHVTTDKDGVIHVFPWYGIVNEEKMLDETFRLPSMEEKRMVRLLTQLSSDEEEMFRNMLERINRIVGVAEELGVRVMIDAEHTYFQPAISRITLEMMYRYNKSKTILLNTYQSYLKESFNEIINDMDQAKRQNFHFGLKLVRGAYIHHERERAAELDYPDPTNPTYEATTEMYHKILKEIFERMKINKDQNHLDKLIVMAATHNEHTTRTIIELMNRYGIKCDDDVIYFAQLLGMCDFITFPLGEAGYAVYKYVPYGPPHDVLPYLSRRAKENKSILYKLKKEKRLLLTEIKRRILGGQIFYKP